jgi:hypothetical protein
MVVIRNVPARCWLIWPMVGWAWHHIRQLLSCTCLTAPRGPTHSGTGCSTTGEQQEGHHVPPMLPPMLLYLACMGDLSFIVVRDCVVWPHMSQTAHRSWTGSDSRRLTVHSGLGIQGDSHSVEKKQWEAYLVLHSAGTNTADRSPWVVLP